MQTLIFNNAMFSYGGPPVLTGVTGSVEAGEALALIGPNGAGKTTLLKGILGAVPLVSGEMTVVGARRPPRGSVGYVPQVADLDPTFPVTVSQVVGMGLYGELSWFQRLNRMHRTRISAALNRVGMGECATTHFGQLSGGQRQRILLARAIVSTPSLILLDEPFNGLDEPNRKALLGIIQSVKADGVTVVASTHDLVLAEETCEKAALLAGQQISFGPIADALTPELLDIAYGRTRNVG